MIASVYTSLSTSISATSVQEVLEQCLLYAESIQTLLMHRTCKCRRCHRTWRS